MFAGDGAGGEKPLHILIVEDEEALRRGFARILENAGYHVQQAANGEQALHSLDSGDFDLVLTDIAMPELNGVELLRAVRRRDLDLPVILLTGNPSIETATAAVEHGALRYLVKPFDAEVLVDAVNTAAKLRRLAQLKREAVSYLGTDDKQLGDRAGLEASFARGLETLWMAYQPLARPASRSVAAFEALVRTREPTLPHPGALFAAAERLGRVHEIGRAIRRSIVATLRERDPNTDMFINLHPMDLTDDDLYLDDSPLAPFAERVVFEITERAALDEGVGVAARVARLRQLGYRIAIDDLGAGYAGLNYFALLTPDVVKIDIALIRDVDNEPIKQKLVRSIVALCRELGMLVVAEGVESPAERDFLVGLECDLVQGYLFAKPGPPFPEVVW